MASPSPQGWLDKSKPSPSTLDPDHRLLKEAMSLLILEMCVVAYPKTPVHGCRAQ